MGGPKRLNKLSNAPDLSKFYNEAGLSAAKKKKKNITGTPGEKEVKTDPFVFVESNIKDQVTKVERGPPRWRHFLNLIQQMRSQKDAPVDTMGCTMLAKRLVDSDRDCRFQTLVALVLSAQTKDEITAGGMDRLYSHLNPLSASRLLDSYADAQKSLADILCPVGFYRKKAEYLLKIAKICVDQYEGDIPKDITALTSLPGVGLKIAHLAMQCAWGINSGIGVDVHVHRIARRLGWAGVDWSKSDKNVAASPKGGTPESTRLDLEDWMPPDLWTEINPLLVGFGQTICLPQRPRCVNCLLALECPSSTLKTT